MRRRAAGVLLLGLALSACGNAAVTPPRAAAPKAAPAPLPGAATTAEGHVCGATGVRSGSSTCTYRKVGSDTFTVPAGVTRVDLSVVGGSGGRYFLAGDAAHGGSPSGDITGRPGGPAGRATATFVVVAGAVLQIDVAGAGADGSAASRSGGMRNGPSGGRGASGGFGGSGDAGGGSGGTAVDGGNGSGGGGASDVRAAAGGCAALRRCPLSARVLVAAGGGGGGGVGGQGGALGGAGGAAGAAGGAVVDGGNRGSSGGGAGPVAGGGAGLNPSRHAANARAGDPRDGGDGAAGVAGEGGRGGAGNLPCTDRSLGGQCSAGANTAGGGAGGGGGGGRFGGGGGSGGGGSFGGGGGAGGGGGGGSSFALPTAITSALGTAPQTAAAEVTVTWAGPR